MVEDSKPAILSWLCNDAVVERLTRGKCLIAFRSADLFRDDSVYADATSAALSKLRKRVPGLTVTRLSNTERQVENDGAQALKRISAGLESKRPSIFFIDRGYQFFDQAACNALEGKLEISRVLLADRLVAVMLSDSIVIENAVSGLAPPSSLLPPMTPIEVALLEAMEKEGLSVKCQVTFSPYVIDFVVEGAGERLGVEADGADFHDAQVDAERDKFIRRNFDIQVVRFTGSRIYRDPEGCAREVLGELRRGKTDRTGYQLEGFDQLDDSQRRAIELRSTNVRVLAPAGSGKTKVLVNRIVSLLNEGKASGKILVVAFNRKAARQLESRLAALGIPTGNGASEKGGVWVATLNSFGNRVLREEGLSAQLLDSPRKERALIQDALANAGEKLIPMRNEDPFAILTREVARVRRGLSAPTDITVEIAQPREVRTFELGPLWKSVRELQTDRGVITFDDQIFMAADLLLREPAVRRIWQRRFEVLLVDEYQDLNPAQILLLRIISAGGAQMFAVGDDDQVIYTWRDAKAVNLLEDFEAAYPNTETVTLEVNYRCPKPIVRCSQRLISHNRQRYPKKISPAETAPEGLLKVQGVSGLRDMGDKLVQFLQSQRELNGFSWSDMAVLSRTKAQLLAAAVALDRAEIPREPLPNMRLYSTPAGQRLIAYLNIMALAPGDVRGDDLAKIINRPNRFVGNERVDQLRQYRDPWVLLALLAYGCPAAQKGNKHLQDLVRDVLEIRDFSRSGSASPVEIIDAVLSRFLFTSKPDASTHSADDATDEIILHVLREDARDYTDLAAFLAHAELSASLELNEKDAKTQQVVAGSPTDADQERVSISTIHGAKGREWPALCIFDASRPERNSQAGSSPAEQEEERRVSYVGMTRASMALCILFAIGQPDRFIAEAILPSRRRALKPAGVDAWVRGLREDASHLQQSVLALERGIEDFRERVANLQAGSELRMNERKHSDLERQKDEIQARIAELSASKPVGLIGGLLGRGMSAKQISRTLPILADQVSALSHQIEKLKLEMSTWKDRSEKLILRNEDAIEQAEQSIFAKRAELDDLQGDITDLVSFQDVPLPS
jgi:DNA helicase II / ATP-dependent DNA helicase PcrA